MPRGLFFSLLLVAAMAGFAAETVKPVALEQTPPAVQKTIQAQIGKGKLGQIEQQEEAGKTSFEVTFTAPTGEERDFSVADDGSLLSVEVLLPETSAAVQKTIREQATGWELRSIAKNVAEEEATFDVEVVKDGRVKTFTVENDGDLSSMERTLAETPAAVQSAIKTQLAEGSVQSIYENFEEDGNSYEIEGATKAGVRKSFRLAPDGQLLTEEVTLDETPPAVRKTILEKIGNGKILRIDKSWAKKTNGVLPYEVEGMKGGKPFDFSVGPHGKFLGRND